MNLLVMVVEKRRQENILMASGSNLHHGMKDQTMTDHKLYAQGRVLKRCQKTLEKQVS